MSDETLRIDKWLWFARFAKTRADAQKLLERGQVALNGTPAIKPSTTVRVGDLLSIVIGSTRHALTIAALGTRRGPAAEAQTLYQRSTPPERLDWEAAAPPLHRRV